MKQEEFASVVLDAKILTPDEIVMFFKFFSSQIMSPVGFSENRKRYGFHHCVRFTRIERSSWDCGGLSIQFYVDKVIILNGVRLFGSENNFYNLKTLKLYQGNPNMYSLTPSVLLVDSESSTYPSKLLECQNFSYHGFEVLFDSKPSLKKKTLYYIEVVISGPKCGKGCRGLRSVEIAGVTFTFSIPGARYTTRDSVFEGQFAELLFSLPN